MSRFYVLLFAMPLTGWMMSSAKKYSVSWFGLFNLAQSHRQKETRQRFDFLRATHDTMSFILLSIAGIAYSRGAQTSLLEQGRRAVAHAALCQIREGPNWKKMTMMRRLVPCLAALSLSAARERRGPRDRLLRRSPAKAAWNSPECRPAAEFKGHVP